MLLAVPSSGIVNSVIRITGIGDRDRPEWLIRINGMRTEEYLTVEPYALGLPKGDDNFRYEIDRALSGIYRSGEVVQIFTDTFGDRQLGQLLQTLYLISAIPE